MQATLHLAMRVLSLSTLNSLHLPCLPRVVALSTYLTLLLRSYTLLLSRIALVVTNALKSLLVLMRKIE
jgi:hypothetical protein